jgi:hypothetical protein
MYAPALEAELEAELLIIDVFDSWSIGDFTAWMSAPTFAPDPGEPEEPADAQE